MMKQEIALRQLQERIDLIENTTVSKLAMISQKSSPERKVADKAIAAVTTEDVDAPIERKNTKSKFTGKKEKPEPLRP
jgi:hypothetical protein